MTKLKIGFISALVIVGVVTPLVVQQLRQTKLREENSALRQQVAAFQTENESLSNRIAQAARTPSASRGQGEEKQRSELLRLRGEVGVLRRQVAELGATNVTSGAPVAVAFDASSPFSSLSNLFAALDLADMRAARRYLTPELLT